jgi:hypothetical protein
VVALAIALVCIQRKLNNYEKRNTKKTTENSYNSTHEDQGNKETLEAIPEDEEVVAKQVYQPISRKTKQSLHIYGEVQLKDSENEEQPSVEDRKNALYQSISKSTQQSVHLYGSHERAQKTQSLLVMGSSTDSGYVDCKEIGMYVELDIDAERRGTLPNPAQLRKMSEEYSYVDFKPGKPFKLPRQSNLTKTQFKKQSKEDVSSKKETEAEDDDYVDCVTKDKPPTNSKSKKLNFFKKK